MCSGAFLAETGMISADVKQALSNMKPKLDNYIFREWVDAAIACQDDKSLKSTLTPIIGKLSDMRIVAAELDYLMYEPFKEFITMAFLLVGNIPLLYFLNKDWYNVLVNTGFGKGILAVACWCCSFPLRRSSADKAGGVQKVNGNIYSKIR